MELNNKPVFLPEIDSDIIPEIIPNNPPFLDDEFKMKWYNRYKNNECNKNHLERLCSLGKLTKEDYTFITKEEIEIVPFESVISKLRNRVEFLEMENADLLISSAIKDSQILTLENDVADIMLELITMKIIKGE